MARSAQATETRGSLGASRPLGPWEQRFTDEEVAEMLRRGACMCGIEAAQRNRFDIHQTLVPTSAKCEAHRG